MPSKKNYKPLKLSQVSEEEWCRFSTQTAKRLIKSGIGDKRK